MVVHHFDLGSHSRHSFTLHTIHFRCAGGSCKRLDGFGACELPGIWQITSSLPFIYPGEFLGQVSLNPDYGRLLVGFPNSLLNSRFVFMTEFIAEVVRYLFIYFNEMNSLTGI